MFNTDTRKMGVSLALVALLLAAMALWAWNGGGGFGGATDSLGFKNSVQWTVRDALGNVKAQGIAHNTTTTAFLEEASDRLYDPDKTIGEALAYDNIQLCSGTQGTPTDCAANTNALLVQLDGVAAGTAGGNPVDKAGTDTAVDGIYSVSHTFTCDTTGADCVAITQLQLTNGVVVDGTGQTGVGAYKNVSVTLADADQLTVTWTITISGS